MVSNHPNDQFLDLVVVTGAGRGLGKAVAKSFAFSGIPVLCISKTPRATQTADQIKAAGGRAESLVLDLKDARASQESVVEWISESEYLRIGVVLAAAITGEPGGLLDADCDDWINTFQINVIGNLAVLKGLMPRMLSAKFGRIVTLAGGGAAYAYPLFSGYSISKTAIVRATENIHEELKTAGDFLAVCLAPGAMETDMLRKIRAAGAEVRTTVAMEEPLTFIQKFLFATKSGFSGRFVHVRDDWQPILSGESILMLKDQWLLRRIEA
jgi:NAD(P)-dependent dehydrogenase (short-subunit alcohol dehydrogenase family)